MYIVKDNNPDVGYTISFEADDAEGHAVPDEGLTCSMVSDDDSIVAVAADETGKAGTISFGGPGVANLNASVTDAAGTLLGSFGAQFTVTVGDPAAIAGGTIAFDGLTEAEAPAPEPVV